MQSSIASVITVTLVLVILSPQVTVPVNAKNVCAYKQHPGTRFPNQSGDQEDEEGITPSQRQEVCPDGQEACFTLWREEAAAAASAAPAAGNQSTSAPVGLESKDSHAVVFVIIAQGCWDLNGYECPDSDCTWNKDFDADISKVNGSSRFCCCRGSECNRLPRPMDNNSLIRFDTGDDHERQRYAIAGSAAIEPASSSAPMLVMTTTSSAGTSDRIFLPVTLCIALICMTLVLVYVAVILFRIRQLTEYSEYMDVSEFERLSKKKNRDSWPPAESTSRRWWSRMFASKERSHHQDHLLPSSTSDQASGSTSSFHIPRTPVIPVEALTVDQLVANGRFGSIYRGSIEDLGANWNDNSRSRSEEEEAAATVVAIKVYNVIHRQVLQKEKEVYRLLFMTGRQHASIPVWFGRVDRKDDGEDGEEEDDDSYAGARPSSLVEMGLVISFAPGGCLDSFLHGNSIDWITFCRMSLSIASGVAFLHSNCIISIPASESTTRSDSLPHHVRNGCCIVHRDLSSKNILIKADMSCMICDFGNALILTPDTVCRSDCQLVQGPESWARRDSDSLRYLAPELLLDSSTRMDSCSWKQVDVYALSLVLWELATRCSDLYQGLPVPAYKKPYEQEVGGPVVTLEQMHVIVTKHKSRPLLADVWKESNPAIKSLRETITDSWDQDADARLTAGCMEERLTELPILWERHRQDQRLLLLHTLTAKSGSAIDQHPATLFNLRNNNSSGHLNDLTVGDVRSIYQMNLIGSHPLVSGEKNVNLSSPSAGMNGSSSVISFPIQPFLGRNPCLQRNLNPVRASDPESAELAPLEHTLKFNPVLRSCNASNNNNNWPGSADQEDEEAGSRINSERNLYPAGMRRVTQPPPRRPHHHLRLLPASRPGPIPEAIHNVCLLPKQQNHHLSSHQQHEVQSRSYHSNSGHADQQEQNMSQSSLTRRLMHWAVRQFSFPRSQANSHLLPEEAGPLSVDQVRRSSTTDKDSLPRVQQQQQQQHNHHPTDETNVVISEEDAGNENANVIRDKGTAPKGF